MSLSIGFLKESLHLQAVYCAWCGTCRLDETSIFESPNVFCSARCQDSWHELHQDIPEEGYEDA